MNKKKRTPKDINQLAIHIVEQSTGEKLTNSDSKKNQQDQKK